MSKKVAVNRRGQYSAPALSKGLDILEIMTSEPEGLGLREIAEKLGRSKGEIFRMLVVLEERGYVTLDPLSDNYLLTLKIFELAHRHSHIKRLSSAAAPVMRKLAREAEQSCHLVIYYNGSGIVIAQQDSPAERGFGVRLGANVPLPNTCSGHVLLAYAEPARRNEMVAEQPTRYRKLMPESKLKEITERVKAQGFEKVTSQQVHGVVDISYPIFDYSGNVPAALSIPFLERLDGKQPVDMDQAQAYLRQAAAAISQALGYTAPGVAQG